MNDLPGYRITDVYGEVSVRSWHIGSDIGASPKGLVGGEIKGYTKMLEDSRLQAIERLRDAAREAGANAVIAMRFDCNELGGNMTEAYGSGHRPLEHVSLASFIPIIIAPRRHDCIISAYRPSILLLFPPRITTRAR